MGSQVSADRVRIKTLFAGGLLALTMFGVAAAGPLEDGYSAYQRGDYATAMRLLFPLDQQGNALATVAVGMMYYNCQGVPQRYDVALLLYSKAALQGNADAQNNAGWMCEHGQGTAQDYTSAIGWYRKAADQGNARAQLNLGVMEENGEGVPANYVHALVWYNFAASGAKGAADQDVAADAVKDRDALFARMSGAQIAEALALWRTANPSSEIPLVEQGGTFVLPVLINNAITLSFVVDSGAADVSIPRDVFSTLIRSGTISGADIIGEQTYRLADGSTSVGMTFRIRVLKVGNRELENVTGSVAPETGTLLLGQSFLSRFNSWSIDNNRHVLLLN